MLPGGGCGHGRSRQAAALGMVPRKLHLCRLLSDQHPEEPPRPPVPASSASSAAAAPAAEVRPETSTSAGPGCTGDVLHCNLPLHPTAPPVQPPTSPWTQGLQEREQRF